MSKIKVLVADDDALVRAGIREYLIIKGMAVCEAATAAEAVAMAISQQPDVVILDIVMPPDANSERNFERSAGLEAVKQIKAYDSKIGIVLFSAHEDRGAEVGEAIARGIRGLAYKLKGCMPSELEAAIRDVRAGKVVIDPEVSTGIGLPAELLMQSLTMEERKWVETALDNLAKLTPREMEVVELLAASRTIEGIADDLGIKGKTVQGHINRIYDKVGLGDINESAAPLRKALLLAKAYTVEQLRRIVKNQ